MQLTLVPDFMNDTELITTGKASRHVSFLSDPLRVPKLQVCGKAKPMI